MVVQSLTHNKTLEITYFDLSIAQGKLLFTKCLFLSSCKDTVKSPGSIMLPLAQDVLYTSTPLSISEPLVHVGSLALSYMRGSHTYVHIKLGYFLLLIRLMLFDYQTSQKNLEGKGKFVPPLQHFPVFKCWFFMAFNTIVYRVY